jgi:hypothetical protein
MRSALSLVAGAGTTTIGGAGVVCADTVAPPIAARRAARMALRFAEGAWGRGTLQIAFCGSDVRAFGPSGNRVS